MACGQQARTEYVYVEREIPEDTLTPCPRIQREINTPRRLAVGYVEEVNRADCNAAKLVAAHDILTAPLPNDGPG